jgi:AcrR family transcriptional regulator
LQPPYDSGHTKWGQTNWGVETLGLREDKKRETRAAIVETALELFRTQGFEGTRIQDIAERLRISEATFFNYFPTKQSVLAAVADGMIDRSVGALAQQATDVDRPVRERLHEVARVFSEQFEGDRAFIALLAGHTHYFLGVRTGRFEHAYLLLSQLFSEGQRRAEIRSDISADELAELFLSLTFATIQGWVAVDAPQPPLDERIRLAASVLIDGCNTR